MRSKLYMQRRKINLSGVNGFASQCLLIVMWCARHFPAQIVKGLLRTYVVLKHHKASVEQPRDCAVPEGLRLHFDQVNFNNLGDASLS